MTVIVTPTLTTPKKSVRFINLIILAPTLTR